MGYNKFDKVLKTFQKGGAITDISKVGQKEKKKDVYGSKVGNKVKSDKTGKMTTVTKERKGTRKVRAKF